MIQFLIADTFSDSLARLTGDEQKAVKTTAFDLQLNPVNPGMSFHRLDRAKDPNFWSVRVDRDLRLIVHRSESQLLLCYVGHHDDAYRWAERRKIERHPTTGAAQLVEIRETVREIAVPRYVDAEPEIVTRPLLFAGVAEAELLAYGVPREWIADVRAATEDSLFEVADHLPREAAEALLEIATGGRPELPLVSPPEVSPFEHPDAQRRFRVMASSEELERALEYPWEKWTVFLHPSQRHIVQRDFSGPARASGSAGTGKTIVALHRAVHLARLDQGARVLLTTFSDTLANALRTRLTRLIGNEPRIAERLEVCSIGEIGRRLYSANFGAPKLASPDEVRRLIEDLAGDVGDTRFGPHFLWAEWNDVVDAWQLSSWEEYRDVRRLGRKTRLAEKQRCILWSIFEKVRTALKDQNTVTRAEMFARITDHVLRQNLRPFDHVIVDEAQDLGVPELRFLAALGADRVNALFFAGDIGQRIFQQPFSWKALGVDIRGRSSTLRINYRTSQEIRRQADRLLDPELSDVDGNVEDRRGTISVFEGVAPRVEVFFDAEEETEEVGEWLRERIGDGVQAHEIAVFVRSRAEIARAEQAVEAADMKPVVLDERMETKHGCVSVATMHLAKGLEFRAVAVMACDDEVIPLQQRIAAVADEGDLEEVYATERHLLYVACTRARDFLWVSGVEPASEFLDDIRGI